MTKVIGINCHKWYMIIGITLWSAATLGLTVGVCYGYQGMVNPLPVPPLPDIGLPMEQFDKQLDDYRTAFDTNQSNIGMFWLTSFASIGNWASIWWVINGKYRFIEIKCLSRNKNESYSHSTNIVSNDEYLRNKESQS